MHRSLSYLVLRHSLASFAVCLWAGFVATALAQEPDYPSLNVRNHEFNELLASEGEAAYAGAIDALERYEGMLQQGNLQRASLQEIGQIYVASQQLRRHGDRLIVLGEPAGKDFVLRGRAVQERLQRIRAACIQQPNYRDELSLLLVEFQRHATAQARNVDAVQQLLTEHKWDEAERTLFAMIDDLDQFGFWFTRRENETLYSPFRQVRRTIDRARQQFSKLDAVDQIQDDLEEVRPDFERLSDTLEKLPDIDDNGTTLYIGERLSCPEALAKLLDDWQETQHRVLQTRALYAALWGAGGDTSQSAAENLAAYQQLCRSIPEQLANMLDADAQRTPPAQAAQRHAEYVAVLAPWVGQESSGLLNSLRPALDRLAARSDDFNEHLTAYQAATDDYLRWCERVAADETAWRAAADYPDYEADYLLYSAKFADDVPGLLNPGANSTDRVSLLSDVPSATDHLRENIVGKNYSFGSAIGLGDSRALLRYQHRALAGLALPANWQQGVDRLEQQLLADADHPPLSLNATAALVSARRGDALACGAQVRNLELLGVTPFFATISEPLTLLTPLGQVPDDPVSHESVEQVFLRYMLETRWARHRYFFIAQPGL